MGPKRKTGPSEDEGGGAESSASRRKLLAAKGWDPSARPDRVKTKEVGLKVLPAGGNF
jgi:hypothetical protein